MGIVVIGDVFIDIKGYSIASYIPQGRNVGTIAQIHGGVGRNVAEDIANLELKPTFISLVNDDAMGEEVIRKLERRPVALKGRPALLSPLLRMFCRAKDFCCARSSFIRSVD